MTTGQMMAQLYLDREETGDITFLVESQRIRAHRSILAAHSSKYKAQFYGTRFLDLAKQSLVDEFVESCGHFLKNAITANNLFDFYGLAILYDIESLRLSCEEQISKNTINVFGSNDFLRCDRDVLRQISKMDALNCNETDVFSACIAWAREYCVQNDLKHWKPENLRASLGDVIDQIRFSSIDAEEFNDLDKSLEGFFTVDESTEILSIIRKLDDFKPQKFNGTRVERSKVLYRIPDWLMQCNRYSRIWHQFPEARKIKETNCLNVYCSCSTPIRLHGIAFDFQSSHDVLDDFPSRISIGMRHDDEGPLISIESKYKVYQNPKKNYETIIMFDKPIDRIIYFSCSFRLPSSQLIYGPELQSSVHSSCGINFSLYGSSVSRFFFAKMVENDGLFQDYGPFVRSSKKYKIPIYEWSPNFNKVVHVMSQNTLRNTLRNTLWNRLQYTNQFIGSRIPVFPAIAARGH